MDTATKTEIGSAKTAPKTVVQETAEATEDLIGNKITEREEKMKQIKNKKSTYHQKKYSKLLMA